MPGCPQESTSVSARAVICHGRVKQPSLRETMCDIMASAGVCSEGWAIAFCISEA